MAEQIADRYNPSQQLTVNADGSINIGDGLAIAQGLISGVSFIHKFGEAPDFDTGDSTIDIWDGANDGVLDAMNYTYSTSADIDSLSSSNNGDTQDIKVEGLDTNFNFVNQTITLTGQTRVALTTDLIRVFRMTNVGTTDFVGQVYCYVNGTITLGVPNDKTTVRAIVNNGNNQTLMALYTIPASKTGYLHQFYSATSGIKKTATYIIDLFVKPSGQVFQLKHRTALEEEGTSRFSHNFTTPEILSAKTDIVMRVKIPTATITGAAVSAGFDLILVDD